MNNLKIQKTERIIMLGDIVGEHGKNAISKYLPKIITKYSPIFITANGENITNGRGINEKDAEFLFSNNIDVITLGNHAFYHEGAKKIFEDKRIIRPANFCGSLIGHGYTIIKKNNFNFCVINLMGSEDMPFSVNNPYEKITEILNKLPTGINSILIDFHAEKAAEKYAMAYYTNGKITAVVGTHTHIPTNDVHILNKGTAYQTDLGMCGNYLMIRGKPTHKTLSRYIYWEKHKPIHTTESTLCGCVIYFNPENKKATSIKPIIYGSTICGAIR